LFSRQQPSAPFLLSSQILDRSGFEEEHGALDIYSGSCSIKKAVIALPLFLIGSFVAFEN
jgi:hypothetical protein